MTLGEAAGTAPWYSAMLPSLAQIVLACLPAIQVRNLMAASRFFDFVEMPKTCVTAPVTSPVNLLPDMRGNDRMPALNFGGCVSQPEANQLPVWKKAALPARNSACAVS